MSCRPSLRSVLALAASLSAVVAAGADGPGRDPWRRPFASGSIWNVAIGSGADYVDAGLPAPAYVGCDIEHLLVATGDDPVVTVRRPRGFHDRWPGGRPLGSLRVPRGFTLPEVRRGASPNACTMILMPDGRTVRQIAPFCRPSARAGYVTGWLFPEEVDLYGDGVRGAHYGSGLSVLGGSLRRGELTGEGPIGHVLKLNLWANRFYYGPDRKGFRWPATRADSYAAGRYAGANRSLVMGTLVCLRPGVTAESLGVETEAGRKIVAALRDYGAYVPDDTAWDAADLCVEAGVPEEVEATFGYRLTGRDGPFVAEMRRIVTALSIVDNNGPASIGGGGVPRRPPASPLKAR